MKKHAIRFVQAQLNARNLAAETGKLEAISKDEDCVLTDLPDPDTLIFGHTHIPKPWDDKSFPKR